MDELDGLIEVYCNQLMEISLTITLSNIVFTSDNNQENDKNSLIQKIHSDGASAFAVVNKYKRIHRHLQNFNSSLWLPIYPLKNSFAECFCFQIDSNMFATKFITPKDTSVSNINFIQSLTSCLRQLIPCFGTVLSISDLELPYTFIGEIYSVVDFKSSDTLNISIFGNFYQLGKINSLKFVASENSEVTISIIQSICKKPTKINLDQDLWRNGFDSLKMATLEFKLKSFYDEIEGFQHGFCLKLQSIRQLLEITNTLGLKQIKDTQIQKCNLNQEKLPITEAQKQLIFLCKTENGNELAEEFYANFVVPLDARKFKEAFIQTFEANPSLRSIFAVDHAKLLPLDQALVILTDKEMFENYKFDVFSKPSLIFFIDGNVFAMKFHHILLDGKSLQLFVNQFMAFYNGNNSLPKNLNYFDFALFESSFLASTDFTKDVEYWITKLSDVENYPKLPKDSNIDLCNDSSGSIITIEFPASLTTKLQSFCSSNSVSLFSTFISFYRLLIYKLYGFTEFSLLISVDNRLDESFQNTIGLFVNLATVSFTLNPNESFESLLKAATKDLNETISHSTVPYNKVISALRNQISAAPAIPEVMLVQDREASFEGVEISSPLKKKFIQNSQIWYLKEVGDRLKLQIEFRNSLFSSEVMQNQAQRFLVLIEKVLQNPKLAVKIFELLTEKEENQFLEFRQSLSHPIPVISPIQLIFQKMEANLYKIVLRTEMEELTSDTLMKKVIQYAEIIKEVYDSGFKQQLPSCDQPVALFLQRSIDLIILVLACWYLNLAPLMIAADWPIDRISTALKGFKNLLLITDNNNLVIHNFDNSISVVSIKTFHKLQLNPTKFHLKMATSNPTDLAYLTFTSGSTGFPKAVQSLQRGLINLWQNYSYHFSIYSESTVYQVVNPAFDIFFADVISAFGNGATLVLASQKIPKISELRHCTHAYIMPAYLSQLDLDDPEISRTLKNLEAILYGGEAINPNFLNKALKVGLNLFQQFGVTEHSVYSNFISPKSVNDRLMVGSNFDNFHGYLIDSDGCRLPPVNLGIQGWFRSAGIAVARGYSSASEVQNQVFGRERWFDGWRYFDSGDRMKYVSPAVDEENPWNCKFVFCGRNDTQIKIRGYRIELRDVEEPFRQHSNVEEVVCLFDGEKLTAFIAFKSPSLTDEKDLIIFAQEKLPNYMIPENFIILEKFPLNSNGKIDRQKLLSMLNESVSDDQNLPENVNTDQLDSNELSTMCCKIFAKHLKVSSISPEDDLFQKGGDSLKLLMAVQEIEDTAGIKLDLAIIFRVRSISKALESSNQVDPKKQLTNVNETYESDTHPLSYSQEHLWFIEKLNNQDLSNVLSDAYILKFKIILLESLPEKRWKNLIKFLIAKHSILQTQIIEKNGIPYLKILQVNDKLVQQLQTSIVIIFIDILNEPPVKFKLSQDLKTIEIGCHHIAIDGYSLNILINDIQTFFSSQQPPTVIPDYKYFDFIKNQRSYDFSKDLQFFQQKLANVKNFSFPTDYPRSQCSSFKAGNYCISFKINGFDDFLNKFKISETHLILGIYALLNFIDPLQSEVNEIAVGCPFANRPLDFTSTVGYFVNVHAIPISRPSLAETFPDFLTQIKQTVLEILSHSSTPFELVVRHLKPKREINKSPIFQQMLIFEDLRNPIAYDKYKVTEIKSNEAKLDQTWRIKRIKNDLLEIDVEYIDGLFKEEMIVKSVESFKLLLTKALEIKVIKIADFLEDKTPQKIVENLWKEILEVDRIDSNANFFEEGGHSLLAARLTSMINAKFGIKASINLLFEHQTLKEYFEAIEKLLTKKDKLNMNTNEKTKEIKAPQRSPVNPLQLPLLELLRKAAESGNISLQEAYVNQIQIQCPNGIKMEEIENALKQLVERHAVLRTEFGYNKTEKSSVEYFQEVIETEYCKQCLLSTSKLSTMNVFEDPVFRAALDESTNIFTLEISHLVSDGHSMNILAKDLFSLFTKQALPELKVDYFSFNQIFVDSAKQQQKEQLEFWSKMFFNLDCSTLETNFVATSFDYSSATILKTFFNANSALAQAVKAYRCSPLALLLHSFAFRFREKLRDFNAPLRIAFCKDMRPTEDYYSCIGFFINTLIIPIEPKDTIYDIEQKVKNAQQYSWITVHELRQVMATNGDEQNLFDVMLVIDNSPVLLNNEKLNGFKIVKTMQKFTKFDLTIFVQFNGKDLNVKAEFRKCLWSDKTIETLLNSWESDGFDEKAPKVSKALPELYLSSKYNILTVDFDERDIASILLEVFEKYGNNIALKTADVEISYKELSKRVIQISHQIKEEYFKATGCLFGPDTIIPVISKNSIEQWLICLGVIFAGGAYLPIDMETPEERILKILRQLQPTLIISDVNISGYESIALKKLQSFSVKATVSKFTNPVNPHNLAYVIFTSGTTGIPKGVCINRLGLSNLISDAQSFFSIDSSSVIYQFTNFCFDNSVLEIFAALGSGATCFIPDGYFTADKFCQNITDYGITHAMLFPGLAETFVESELMHLKKLKCWICGAEKLSKNLFEKAMNLGINIIQNYGPTETTAYCLRKKLERNDDPQNLGRPVQNATVSIRRPDGWEAMNGSKFELFVSSIGLTRGYLGREWKDQPFVTFKDGLIYYPSGDICQRLPSGEIRFVGRKDNQVKIRGFRIELDEIESCLLGYPNITAAKVMLNQKMEDLIAFYSSKTEIETKVLKDFLKKKLPHYMIPRFFVFLKAFPLTSNSKIDTKKLLLEYETSKPKSTNSKDTNESMEAAIKHIWQKILKLDSLEDFDSNDSFIYLGGNSLTFQMLVTTIKNELKFEIKVEEFYRNPTINSIIQMAQTPEPQEVTRFKTLSVFDRAPLSYQQEQMLYLEQIDPESSYNLAFIQEFNKTLDVEKLKSAFYKLLEENAEFRIMFKESEDGMELYQETVSMEKCFIDVNVESFYGTKNEKTALKEFKQKKFDLFNEIPLRVKILETSDRYIVLLIIHHAFSDATTTMLMEKEMTRIYQGKMGSSNVNRMSYLEYSTQQKDKMSKEKFEALTIEYLEDYGSAYKLYPAKIESIFETNGFSQLCETFKFNLSLSKSKFTPFTLITAAITKTFLSLFPEDTFLLLGCPFANRTPETAETFGNFLDNLLLPLTLKQSNISLDELQLELLKLTKYGIIPFQHLCKSLRQKAGINSVNIQIYLNCRYHLENEAELGVDEIESNGNNVSVLHEIFEEVINYPIEIDLDELHSTTSNTAIKDYEITIRMSKTFFEANKQIVKQICENFQNKAKKIFGPKDLNLLVNDKMISIFNKFLQTDLTETDMQKSFIDLGGDSILAMKLRRAVLKEAGIELDLKDLMTAKSLAEILNPNQSSKDGIIEFYRNQNIQGALIVFVYPLVGGCLVYSSLIKHLKSLHQSKIQCIVGLHPPSTLPRTMEELALLHKTQLLKTYDLSQFSKIVFIGASFGAALGYQLCQELSSSLTLQSLCLISIDGTLKTSPESMPSFEGHKKQITDVITSFSAENAVDINFEGEIHASWKLLQMASNYAPKPLLKPFKCVLLYTSGSEHLQNLWKIYVPQTTVARTNGSHETMLSAENSEEIAVTILSNV